ncbi:hypothetical protein [Leptolyngbya sp. PCC 6406]|uniref:hypothetical protein n=1 Tax=Leptolyngbya sp. PCC 6406 TaxID=1173264 RepID=UPI0002AC154F|nr:hypothetical protein [Leptolyngbya sp. PCC 6406]
MVKSGFRWTVALLLACLAFTSACSSAPAPSRWDAADTAAVEAPAATDDVLAGSAFNKFFPAEGDGYERIYTQEKSGFAEAKLKQGGSDLAMLSVSDTAANPSAATRYRESDRAIAGYPAAEIGSTATGVLVGDRLQVKVLSRSDDFSPEDRAAWLEKFDLDGLESLVK